MNGQICLRGGGLSNGSGSGWNEKAEAGDLILSLELEQSPSLFLLRLQVVWPL